MLFRKPIKRIACLIDERLDRLSIPALVGLWFGQEALRLYIEQISHKLMEYVHDERETDNR